MSNWIKRNLKNIIVAAFIVPILLVAFVSISHVTTFYGISNPFSWSLYLSVGIEIAALSALAAVSVRMGKFIYIPFIIVTLIQMIGNIFFSFSYIDESSEIFQDWISMVGGLFENIGVETTDIPSHKFILSFLTGGLLPIISLTFAHMLVKYSEQNESIGYSGSEELVSLEDYEKKKQEFIKKKIQEEENLRYKPTNEDLKKFEEVLSRYDNKTKHQQPYTQPKENKKTNLDENFFKKLNNAFQDLGKGMKNLNNLTQVGKKPSPQVSNISGQKKSSETEEELLRPKISKTYQIKDEELKKKVIDEVSLQNESPIEVQETIKDIDNEQVVKENTTELVEQTLNDIEKTETIPIFVQEIKTDFDDVELIEENTLDLIEEIKTDFDNVELIEENTLDLVEEIKESDICQIPKEEFMKQEITEQEPQEIKPNPVDPDPRYKILKYFKNSD